MENKYKELFEYSKEVYNEELSRFFRIDEKASKYLSILTLLLGGFGYFGIWVLDNMLPPKNFIEWLLLINLILLFLSLIIAWYYNFSALKLHSLIKLPLDSETIEFFNNNEQIDIYFALSKELANTNIKNKNETDKKSKNLFRNYVFIIISVGLLTTFTIFFSIYKWNNNYHKKVEVQMSEENNTSKQESNSDEKEKKPNPNVKPPKFQIVTEGFDPGKKKSNDSKKEENKQQEQKDDK